MKMNEFVCLEGNGTRPSHKGDGWKMGGAMYTLNSTEVHCVCYAEWNAKKNEIHQLGIPPKRQPDQDIRG